MHIRSLSLLLFASITRAAIAGCPTPVMTQAQDTSVPGAAGMAVADFNKDGKVDYAIAVPGNTSVEIHLGNGDGTFATGVPYPAGGIYGNLLIGADFNNDGYTDLALIIGDNPDTFVSVLLNNGNGTFAVPKTAAINAVSGVAFSLRAVDMNDDGFIDVVASGQPATILYGAGDGTFSSRTTRNPSTLVNNATGADLNNDGRTDLILTTSEFYSNPHTYAVAIYLQGQDGLPGTPSITWSSRDPNGGDIAAFDLDGDGFKDLVVTYSPEWAVSIYHNNGNGTFAAPVETIVKTAILNEELNRIVPADINEDGITDLVFGAMNADDATMMIGNGDGTFQAAQHIPMSAAHYSIQLHDVAVADVNGDGRPDVLYLDPLNDTVFLLINGCTSRYAAVTVGSSANPSTYGDAVTITATVTARNGGHATGTISFNEAGAPLGTVMLSGATPSTASLIIPKLSLGAHVITAVYSGDATYGSSTGKLTQTVNKPVFGIPLDFTATGNPGANTIALQWVGSTSATTYEVSRMTGGNWSIIATPTAESLVDTQVSPSQAYFYRVRALQTGGAPSGYAIDAATTYVFTHTMVAGGTIFASDMVDLRTCADYLRAAAGVSAAAAFTDLNPQGIVIKAVHMSELRSALSMAMTTAGMPAPSFVHSVAPGVIVLAADFNELRTMMH